MDYNELREKFSKTTVAVIGDYAIDHCFYYLATKLCPEAPCPTGYQIGETKTLGGAGNTANNILSLGGKVIPVAIVGDDEYSKYLINFFVNRGVDTSLIFQSKTKKLHFYRREYFSNSGAHAVPTLQCRIEREPQPDISKEESKKIIDGLKNNLELFDAIVLSDYSKGIVVDPIINYLSKIDKIVLGDSRPQLHKFKNFNTLVPNDSEAYLALTGKKNNKHLNEEEIKQIGVSLKKKLNPKNLIITAGPKGMIVFDGDEIYSLSATTTNNQVLDIIGAGDTVAAAIALALGAGFSLYESASFANKAAGVVVRKQGTATCTLDEIISLFL
ncbi:MAG: PfkB family carbohydrate kinase [Candidatus Nanoarchaeia archaeon]|nr:PfkB family carbohydrate kinase [Candidatus Nanoarchaeia archaeon]